MTPQQLRNSILQMAIEGKLTEQRAEDGNASDLLKEIKAEKAKLIAEKKIKKEKSLPEISEDEIPFEIPDNWVWCRLGRIVYIARGGSPRPIKEYLTTDDSGINWIKIGDTDKGGKYINSTNEKIIPEGMKKSRLVHKGDFLLSNSMSFGRPYILNIDGCIHDGWLVLSQFKEVFDKLYLYYLLSSAFIYNQFSKIVAGAVVNNLNSEKVSMTLIPLPPLAEQKRIVARLEKILPQVDEYEKAYNELQELNKKFPDNLKNSLLQMAIEGKLVEQRAEDGNARDLLKEIQAEKAKLIAEKKIKKEKPLPEINEDETPFEIPDNWVWCKLGMISNYAQPKVKIKPQEITKNMWSLDLEDIEKNTGRIISKISTSERSIKGEKVLFKKGNILYSKLRPYLKKILIADEDGITTPELVPFNIYGDSYQEYFLWYLRSPYVDDTVNSVCYGVKMPRVGTDTMLNLLVPLPPLTEQKRIVAKLEQLLPLCDELGKECK